MAITDLETVKLDIDSGVARIVLNRPEALNAWTRQLGEDMRSALDQAAEDPDVRAIVFTGAGRAFSSGADLKAGAELEARGTWDQTALQMAINRGSLDVVAELGIRSVIQPGGSKRDAEVIAAADDHGIAMVFTGTRHFRH